MDFGVWMWVGAGGQSLEVLPISSPYEFKARVMCTYVGLWNITKWCARTRRKGRYASPFAN